MNSPPALVLVPGLLCDEVLWRAQLQYFAPFTPVTVAVAAADDSIEAMAAGILRTAPARFALCGISMGGYVCLEVMRQAPERVTHLTLADTSARADTPEQARHRLDLLALAERGRFQGVTRRLLPQLLGEDSLGNAETCEAIVAMSRRMGRDVYARQQRAIIARPDSRPGLGLIACPTLVVVGAEDKVTPPEVARETASLIAGSRLAVIARAGHLPPIEKPADFNRVLGEFLQFV